jgi:hypothetical protein
MVNIYFHIVFCEGLGWIGLKWTGLSQDWILQWQSELRKMLLRHHQTLLIKSLHSPYRLTRCDHSQLSVPSRTVLSLM